MAVHLTRIYTRTGDAGTTGLSDFSRVRKTHPRLDAYADTEEANAALGVALSGYELPAAVATALRRVQNDLFDVGADLATPVVSHPEHPPLRVTSDQVARLERWCDEFNAPLDAVDSFVLPGGSPGAATLHVARTVTRRAERSAWAAVAEGPEDTAVLPAHYLNRLSDLLFVLSRVASDAGDVLWRPGGPADEGSP